MRFDEFFDVLYWVVIAIICGIMATLGYFVPWFGPTGILVIVGIMVAVTELDKSDAVQGIVMFLFMPLIGTAFRKPNFDLGQYEWLVGLWATAFAIGYIVTYILQTSRKKSEPSGDGTVH